MTEPNNGMLRHRYAVKIAGLNVRGLKFSEICENSKELEFKTEPFCRNHFPISKGFKEKVNFIKYLGVVQSFGDCSAKVERQGKQRHQATD